MDNSDSDPDLFLDPDFKKPSFPSKKCNIVPRKVKCPLVPNIVRRGVYPPNFNTDLDASDYAMDDVSVVTESSERHEVVSVREENADQSVVSDEETMVTVAYVRQEMLNGHMTV